MWMRQKVVGQVSDENDALHFNSHGDVTEGFGHLLDRKTFTICYFTAVLEQPWVEELLTQKQQLTQKPKIHTHSSEQKLPGRTDVRSWRLFCCLYDCAIDPSWSDGAVSACSSVSEEWLLREVWKEVVGIFLVGYFQNLACFCWFLRSSPASKSHV